MERPGSSAARSTRNWWRWPGSTKCWKISPASSTARPPRSGSTETNCGSPRSTEPGPANHQKNNTESTTLAEIIVVTSGKGGVGKTTTSASIASGLARRGKKTAVIDFDVGLRNLDLIMGCERRVVYDLVNVVSGDAKLNQALIKDRQCENLFILPASQTRDKDALTEEGIEQIIKDLAQMGFDYVVCDSPAG